MRQSRCPRGPGLCVRPKWRRASVIFLFLTTILPSASAAPVVVVGDAADKLIRPPSNNLVDGQTSGRLGAAKMNAPFTSQGGYRVAEFVFRLPTPGPGELPVVTAASLTFTLTVDRADGAYNIDLFGLPARATSDVLSADNYVGPAASGTGTLVQDDLIPAAHPNNGVEVVTASGPATPGGASALAAYLTAQYGADGSGAGKWVFLRLNPDAVPGNEDSGMDVAFAEAGGADAPRLTFSFAPVTATPEPGVAGVVLLGAGIASLRRRRRRVVRRRPAAPRRARRSGFTLVELLASIGIIAVLLGLLLPALGRARRQANLVKCAANMRQLAQGMFAYAVQWQRFPPNWDGPSTVYWPDPDRVGGIVAPDGWAVGGVGACPSDLDGTSLSYSMNAWTSSKISGWQYQGPPAVGALWGPTPANASRVILLAESWSRFGSDRDGWRAVPSIGYVGATPGARFGGGGGVVPFDTKRFGPVNCELDFTRHRPPGCPTTGVEPVGRANFAYADGHVALRDARDLVDPQTGRSTLDSLWSPLDARQTQAQ